MKTEIIYVKDLRKKWGISRKEFAEHFGISYSTASGWETRNATPLTVFYLIQYLKDADFKELKRLEQFNYEKATWKLRKFLGMDLDEFAREIDVTVKTLKRWEKPSLLAKGNAAPEHINRICRDILNHYLY